MSHSENMNYLGNHNYPVNINDNAYKSCSNDEYDALESNVPYISKNRPYSPKSKLYHTVNNWDILAFMVVTTLLVLLLFTTTQIKNRQNNIVDYHDPDNSPASIYQNYNHVGNEESEPDYYKINTRNLYDHHSADLSYLDHFDELNEGSNYYSEYYKARLQELCDLSLKKASSNHAKKI
jgi:hypothetical protein